MGETARRMADDGPGRPTPSAPRRRTDAALTPTAPTMRLVRSTRRRSATAPASGARAPSACSYVTIHGYRRAYVKAGSGPALLLIHGIGDSSDTWRPVVEQLAEHYTVDRPGPPRARSLGEAAGRLLGGGLRQRHARPPERAGGRPGHGRRAFARRRRGGAVRLPVPRPLRAPGAGGQRGSGPHGQPAAARGRGARRRGPDAAPRPRRRSAAPAAWAQGSCASSTRRSAATPRRSWPCSTPCPTPRPAWRSCAPCARAWTGTARSSPCWTGPIWPRASRR